MEKLFTLAPDASSTYGTKSVILYQGYSIYETTMQRYKGTPQPSQGYIPLVTKIQPTTKAGNPFDVEDKYLIKYPVNSIGYYCCGSIDHYRTK